MQLYVDVLICVSLLINRKLVGIITRLDNKRSEIRGALWEGTLLSQ